MGDSLLIKHGKKVKFQVLREPKHIFVLDPCFKNKGQGPGMVSHSCNPSYSESRVRRIGRSRPALAKLVRPYLKNKIQIKRCWSIAQSSRELVLAKQT
jgi:hypothetical protein